MARKSKLARKQNTNSVIVLVIIVTLIMVVIAGLGYLLTRKSKPLDPVTLCPEDGPTTHTIVLIDNTEPYGFVQRQALNERLRGLATSKVAEGSMLSVFVLGESFSQNALPVFEKCNPGAGTDKSSLYSNPARLKKRYEGEFVQPILDLTSQIALDKPSKQSPVFEMIQLVSINGFSRVGVAGKKTLMIYSDMLAHMPEYSMFKGVPDFSAFISHPYGRRTQALLPGVDVHIHYLLNYPALQTTKQAAFWEQYFGRSGAYLVEVKALEG